MRQQSGPLSPLSGTPQSPSPPHQTAFLIPRSPEGIQPVARGEARAACATPGNPAPNPESKTSSFFSRRAHQQRSPRHSAAALPNTSTSHGSPAHASVKWSARSVCGAPQSPAPPHQTACLIPRSRRAVAKRRHAKLPDLHHRPQSMLSPCDARLNNHQPYGLLILERRRMSSEFSSSSITSRWRTASESGSSCSSKSR